MLVVVTALVVGGAIWGVRSFSASDSATTNFTVNDVPAGTYPQYVALNPWNRELYVTTGYDIRVLNSDRTALDPFIAVPSGSKDIAFDTVAKTVWTHNNTRDNASDSHVVTVIDTATRQATRTIRFQRPVIALGIDSELRRAFVVNRPDDQTQTPSNESWVSVVDTDTFDVISEYTIDLAGYGVDIDPATHIALIRGWMGTLIFSTESPGTLSAPRAVKASNSSSVNVALDKQQQHAYVYTDTDMVTYNTLSGDEISRSAMDIDISDMAVSREGMLWTVDSESDSITVYDPATWAPITSIDVGDQPISIATDPDTGLFFTSNNAGQSVSVIEPAG